MKIAYLILAHSNPKVLTKLVKTLNNKNTKCFIHIDSKALFGYEVIKDKKSSTLEPRYSINWGGFSQVSVIIKLLKEANKEKFDRYVLLSGDSYPVKSNEIIFNFFKQNKNKEFINTLKMPTLGKTMDRVEYYYLEFDPKRVNIKNPLNLSKFLISRLFRKCKIQKKKFSTLFNMKLYCGSTWWALSNNAVEYILSFTDDESSCVSFFKTTLCPDEMFFQTILSNSHFVKSIEPGLVFTDWRNSTAPKKINYGHFKYFKGIVTGSYGDFTPMFARKFSENNYSTTLLIDRELRKK